MKTELRPHLFAMGRVTKTTLPDDALLARYRDSGDFTDCYRARVPFATSFEDFVTAFYTTRLFKVERFLLRIVLRKPSQDHQARELADGARDDWAAWTVEARAAQQLLLVDMSAATRSWFMIEPGDEHSTLYFGSAVIAHNKHTDGEPSMGFAFRALIGFHKLYSVALLKACVRKLNRQN